MKILKLDIEVDKLPDACRIANIQQEGCVFNYFNECIFKKLSNQDNCSVIDNVGFVPEDCPLKVYK